MKTITLRVRNKTTQIIDDVNESVLKALQHKYRFVKEGIKEIRLFSADKKVFYTGLLPQVQESFDFYGYKTILDDTRETPVPLEGGRIEEGLKEVNEILMLEKGWKLRPFQEDMVRLGLEHPQGAFQLPTGFGKSVVFASIAYILNQPTMLLVDSAELMHQAHDTMSLFFPKEDLGMFGDGIKDPKRVTVGIVDSIINRIDLMDSVEYIITDEAHLAAADQFRKVILRSNARTRHGFTGTYTRSVSAELNLLYSVVGPKLVSVTSSELIEKGVLARPNITMAKLPDLREENPGINRHAAINRFIVNYKLRNRIICEYVKKHYLNDKRILVFVTRVKHGELLKDMMSSEFGIDRSDIVFSHGFSGKENRKSSLKKLASGDYRILIATKIFEKGIDLPIVEVGVNAKGERTRIGCLQTLGRLMRGGGDCYMLDFIDRCSHQMYRASMHRKEIYEEEDAFRVEVVNYANKDKRSSKPSSVRINKNWAGSRMAKRS